jgi:hypothetical protein
MALTDLFKLHDPSLADKFNVTPYNASKDRKAFIKSLNATVTQLQSGNTKVPNRMWTAANDVVELKPTFQGRPIVIMGEDTFYVHQEHFAEAIKYITQAVEAGELDDQLEGAEGSAAASAPTAAKSKRGTGIGNVAKPDDAEWMAKFREWAGEPDPSIVDPVPNSSATKWVPKAFAERGRKAKATSGKKK